MTTYSGLRSYKIAEREAEEMRDKALFGISDAKLGTIEEVIFDTATGGIRQVVVDTKCRKRVLLPALGERLARYLLPAADGIDK